MYSALCAHGLIHINSAISEISFCVFTFGFSLGFSDLEHWCVCICVCVYAGVSAPCAVPFLPPMMATHMLPFSAVHCDKANHVPLTDQWDESFGETQPGAGGLGLMVACVSVSTLQNSCSILLPLVGCGCSQPP